MSGTGSGTTGSPESGPRPLDGILFDIDDTLVDTRGAFAQALAGIARRYLPHLDGERQDELLAAWRADAGGHYVRYTRGETDHRSQRMARANALHAQFGGAALDDAGYEEWDRTFEHGFASAWAAHPEALDVVRRLVASGLAIGALSNAAVAYQTQKLDRAGFSRHVPMLVGVDTLGVGKPDPRVFLEACRRLGTAPARTAYVGDELDVDARAAVRAGLVGVWVDRPGPRRTPIPDDDIAAARSAGVHVIRSLAELPDLVGSSAFGRRPRLG